MNVGFCTLSSISVKKKHDSWSSIFISGISSLKKLIIILRKILIIILRKNWNEKILLEEMRTKTEIQHFKNVTSSGWSLLAKQIPRRGHRFCLKNQRPQFVLIRSYGVPLRDCCQGYNAKDNVIIIIDKITRASYRHSGTPFQLDWAFSRKNRVI